MTDRAEGAEDREGSASEKLDREIYGALGKLGWRLPTTEAEVKAAEEWAARTPVELPPRLRGLAEVDRSRDASNAPVEKDRRLIRAEDERRTLEERNAVGPRSIRTGSRSLSSG